MSDPLQPPVPFDDFTFSFDPAIHGLFPSPPPLPSAADLFTQSETTDLLGFFDNLSWDLEADLQDAANISPSVGDVAAQQPLHSQPPHISQSEYQTTMAPPPFLEQQRHIPSPQSNSLHESSTISLPSHDTADSTPSPTPSNNGAAKAKPLLSTPQKRLNHIMSEQKRRNAIRDGYMQLTALLAPAGAPPGAGMPTRGRPKGSGSRNNGRAGNSGSAATFKGKSGILFRAVEYVKWLEEGRDALLQEALKVEAAAGVRLS